MSSANPDPTYAGPPRGSDEFFYQMVSELYADERRLLLEKYPESWLGNHMIDDLAQLTNLALWEYRLHEVRPRPEEDPVAYVKNAHALAKSLMRRAVSDHVTQFKHQFPLPTRTEARYRELKKLSEKLVPADTDTEYYDWIRKNPNPDREIQRSLLAWRPPGGLKYKPTVILTEKQKRKIDGIFGRSEIHLNAPPPSGEEGAEPDEVYPLEDACPPPGISVVNKEFHARLQAYLKNLPASQRDIVARRFGLTPYNGPQKLIDIARARGVTPQSVDNCLKRALNTLNKLFKEDDAPVATAPEATPTGSAKRSKVASEKPSKSSKAVAAKAEPRRTIKSARSDDPKRTARGASGK